ncbi:hypothetical protein [Tenacibaculum caenipelagi]|uniref:Uncharacterized protein n=1 Tax=Tenacibaculum caenipelagi TaxID=1325435 RepID=A0A4R6TE70_9FLAO|nr:hypothetical protein [Tenacibaculum caenipelagi]TDQ27673.1 hypothetical protein DFQ07_1524 [Tenacibaculum caenipelagi]
MNSYELSRQWFDFSFENPELIRPIHTAIYFFAIEQCNRLGWKEKFGLPSHMVMEAIGVKNWKTYKKGLTDLVNWGFIDMIEESKNQHTSNIVAIVNNTKATTKALDKATSIQSIKQSQSTLQGTVSINKPINHITNKPINKQTSEMCDFEKLICNYFSQTTESQKIKVHGFLRSLKNKNEFENFKKQTLAYFDYKKHTKEKIHGWWGYQSSWDETDWVDKKIKLESETKQSTVETLNRESLIEKMKEYE